MSVNFKNASIRNATISPRIVYDSSLVLALDPANPVSYPGTGLITNNLITPDVFTLTNGAGYDSTSNGGVFTFDGLNDYIESNNSISYSLANGFTLMQWVKLNNHAGGTYSQNVSGTTNYNFINFYFGGNLNLRWETHVGNDISSTSPVPLNTWTLLTGTMSTLSNYNTSNPNDIYGEGTARIYLNGVFDYSSALTPPPGPITRAASPSINTNVALGCYTFIDLNANPPSRILLPSNSSIGQTLFYTRELSAAEILQNYNALRYRYGV